MDSVLLANLASRVGPDDALWIIGDFAFGPRAKDAKWLGGIFARLPGAEKHLVVGNHDGNATQDLPWSSVTQITEVSDGENASAVLCHYPMITWHRARKGALHLFGHVHQKWRGSRNSVNVGVDVWSYLPVSMREIEQRARTLSENLHWTDVEN